MNDPSRERRRAGRWLFVVPLLIALLLTGFVLLLGWAIQPPPQSEPIARKDLVSGQPFDLAFISDGQEYRIFMDMECDPCALPIEGEIEVLANGKVVKAVEVSVGEREVLDASSQSFREHPITSIPPQAAGVQVTLRGRLTIPVAPRETSAAAASPTVRLFQLSLMR